VLWNKAGGVIEDVTIATGLAEPISTELAGWGDYNNDGKADLFVCGEYTGNTADPCYGSRLYHNQGNGTFVNVMDKAGVTKEYWSGGCAWGDPDRDGQLDLFVSNMDGTCRLFHNEGYGAFQDTADEMGIMRRQIDQPVTCWFWDFDNDWLDMFVNDYDCSLAETIADYIGLSSNTSAVPTSSATLRERDFAISARTLGSFIRSLRVVPEPRSRTALAKGQAGWRRVQPLGARSLSEY